jgi:APA family basic amino acid/polyamine antiporter
MPKKTGSFRQNGCLRFATPYGPWICGLFNARILPVQHELRRILGTGFGLAVVVGGSVGIGILRMPGIVAGQIGNVAWILGLWLAGGIYALAGANSLAELATALPEAGGGYVYIKRAYGNFFGFAGGMNDFVLSSCGAAYAAVAAGEYAAGLIRPLAGHPGIAALAILSAVTAINWIGLRAGDISQKIASTAKMVALIVLAGGCFLVGDGGAFKAPQLLHPGANPILGAAAIALALQGVMETYAGWNSPVYFSEENVDASRSIPRALFGGLIAVTLVYVLVNAALLYALPQSTIAASKLPAADAAGLLFGAAGSRVIGVLALLSVIGILNTQVLYIPRVLFAMSRDGFLPRRIEAVNSGGTPAVALSLTSLLISVFIMSGTFETLLAIAAFLGIAGDSVVWLALFVLRRREPDLPRPYRAFGYPLIPALVFLGGLILVIVYVAGNPVDSLISMGILLAFLPIYLLTHRSRSQRRLDEVTVQSD